MDVCYLWIGKRGKTRKITRLVRLHGGDTTKGKVLYLGKEYPVERQVVVGEDGQITYQWIQREAKD